VVARVFLHFDDDNFVCEGSRAPDNGIKAEKGPTYFRNRAPLRQNPALVTEYGLTQNIRNAPS